MKLYHSHQSRSVRPRWMLEELGVPYELARVQLDAGDHKQPGYLKLNPNGTIPTLIDGDVVVYESAAICQYLADRFPEKGLAPKPGTPEGAKYLQWCHYAMSAIEPPAITVFMHTILLPEAERIPQLVEPARAALGDTVRVVDEALAGRDWLLGAKFSTADVMIGSTLVWAQMMGLVGSDRPNVQGYLGRIAERPAYQKASAD